MFVSKPGKTVFLSALSLAAAPALAMEPAPLDSAALSAVTALGTDDLTLPAWLPEPGDRTRLLLPAGIDADSPAEPDHGLVRTILQSGRSTLSLVRQDLRGTISPIVQTATIDLPRTAASSAAVGVIMQSGGYEFGGGQSATNLAVAATLNGAGGFASIRP